MFFHNLPHLAVSFALSLVLISAPTWAEEDELEEFEVGVLALRGHAHARDTWQPTIDFLEQQLPEYKFNLHTYNFEQLEDAFLHGWLDFFLTSPGQATTLARSYPVSWLATQRTAYSDIPNKSIASVVLVKQDSKYQTFSDLSGVRLAAVSDKAFGGYLAFRYELDKLDHFNNQYFRNIEFTGPPTDRLILDLLDDRYDSVIVPACTLEAMVEAGEVDIISVRVINAQNPANSVCTVSTDLYPNWTFAMTDRAPTYIGGLVAQALLAMPKDHLAAKAANNVGWMHPAPSVQLDKAFKQLNMHPLQTPFGEKLNKWLTQNRVPVGFGLLMVFFMAIYHVILELKFKRSQTELRETLNDLRRKSALLEQAQRTSIAGELGSSIAHEINQPLAAIKNYSQGMKIRMQKGTTPEEMVPIIDKIQHQVTSASSIIQRLRDLINKKPIEKREIDLDLVVSECIELLDFEFQRHGVEVIISSFGMNQAINADETGIQQLLLNLLVNAKDACVSRASDGDSLTIEVHVEYQISNVVIDVIDNGIGFDDEAIPLTQAFYTTKENGLGLGLAICRDVVESHHGNIEFNKATPNGCIVTVTLPYSGDKK
ncbi:sensor histidine kinase [Vibrio mexicanus]|uniref:sensor histidine kinase n=1 Tax=Vibrio mexicanus TaxID=1004326 RepID=UPI00069C6308